MYYFPVFDFGTFFGNAASAGVHTALGRDCRGRPQGDYFYGCQVMISVFLIIEIVIVTSGHTSLYLHPLVNILIWYLSA